MRRVETAREIGGLAESHIAVVVALDKQYG